MKISVVQIWVDPNHRNAHRDLALRKFLLDRNVRFGQLAIVRYNSTEAIVLLPPPFSPTGKWIEHEAVNVSTRENVVHRNDTEEHHG